MYCTVRSIFFIFFSFLGRIEDTISKLLSRFSDLYIKIIVVFQERDNFCTFFLENYCFGPKTQIILISVKPRRSTQTNYQTMGFNKQTLLKECSRLLHPYYWINIILCTSSSHFFTNSITTNARFFYDVLFLYFLTK